MEFIRFDSDDIENVLARLSDEEIDQLAFGAIKIDRTGKVLLFNAAEGELSGADPKEVIGKNFFEDVAPCTKTADFYGRFLEGAGNGDLSTLFEYRFDYKMKSTKVKCHMKKAAMGDAYWILVKRISGPQN